MAGMIKRSWVLAFFYFWLILGIFLTVFGMSGVRRL
jgi:hypothetical protein